MKSVWLIAAFLLLNACGSSNKEEVAPERLFALQQQCSSAGESAFKRWKATYYPDDEATYTTHYNRKRSLCLIKINSTGTAAAGRYTAVRVMDALENRNLLLMNEVANPAINPTCQIELTVGSRQYCDKSEELIQLAQTLMSE